MKKKQKLLIEWRKKLICGIGGSGRLSAKAIKSIQGHYGLARRYNDNLNKIKKNILKIFNHRKGDHRNSQWWCSSAGATW